MECSGVRGGQMTDEDEGHERFTHWILWKVEEGHLKYSDI